MAEMYGKISVLARQLVQQCAALGLKVSTAESCTGGMLSAAITSVPGSSAVIELGICSYSNRIKSGVLGVGEETLNRFSEYSTACAKEMARGVMTLSGADLAAATSGIAGPDGGTENDPVGTVYICVADRNSSISGKFLFENNGRDSIRAAAAEKALEMLLEILTDKKQTAPKSEKLRSDGASDGRETV